MSVFFIGHRDIEKSDELILSLKETVEMLISKGVTTFLFGSKSKFNDLSWKVVTEFKEKKHPNIFRVYVRSANQYIGKEYEKYLLNFYEKTYFPPKLENAGKSSYIERNYDMIDSSDYCVFYYNENYQPKVKCNKLYLSRRNSGTKIAYKYALKNNKKIINLYK